MELSDILAEDMGFSSILEFIFLFIIVWWGWFNGSLYHDLHGNNDIRTRVFTFLQMLGIISMAIFAQNAMNKGSLGFLLSYAFFHSILAFLWWRTGVHDPDHAPLSGPYSFFFLLSTIIWLSSIFVDGNIRFLIWALVTVFSLLMPLFIMHKKHRLIRTRKQIDIITSATSSLVERFGLLIIIVLGDIFIDIVSGATHHPFSLQIFILVLLSSLIVMALWWLYFDFVSHRKPHNGISNYFTWIYLHLILTITVTIVGACIFYMIEHYEYYTKNQVSFYLITSLIIILFTIAAIIRVVQHSKIGKSYSYEGGNTMLFCGFAMIALYFVHINTIFLLTVLLFLLLIPVWKGFIVWVRKSDSIE